MSEDTDQTGKSSSRQCQDPQDVFLEYLIRANKNGLAAVKDINHPLMSVCNSISGIRRNSEPMPNIIPVPIKRIENATAGCLGDEKDFSFRVKNLHLSGL